MQSYFLLSFVSFSDSEFEKLKALKTSERG